jgi:hypothetical protein
MKAKGGVDEEIQFFLILALIRGEWSSSCTGSFIPEERVPDTHWIRGWMGPRTGMHDVGKRKFLTLPGLELRPFPFPFCSKLLYSLLYFSRFKFIISAIPKTLTKATKCYSGKSVIPRPIFGLSNS